MWQKSRSKYHAKKIKTDEGTFDSKKEYLRYLTLKEMLKNGEIAGLTRQVKYELIPPYKEDGKVIERGIGYIADFVYVIKDTNEVVVEDAKGVRTPEYIIKRKLMLYQFGIKIHEV